ncbi:unnamed protein product [Cercopithifilaria johnstoni]|uniref:Ig-like domain-containing protein n=1 Tax=Cercopithifilaria johnstoni TaxID=2874296 RepID=A0A8J2Q0Y7_9BILA|nr:unnamed protein product [Cercopithifilaria johnstoni]
MLHVTDFTTIYLLTLIALTMCTSRQRNIFERSHIVQTNIQKGVKTLNDDDLNAEHLTEAPYLHFTKTPKEVEISEGNELVLKCEAIGIPPPVIEWARNDNLIHAMEESNGAEKLHNAGLSTTQYGVTVSKMVVPCIKTKNAAKYKCLASNGYQKLESGTIVVEGNVKCSQKHSPPIINMWTDSRFERSGATVQLFCRVYETPRPNITWYNEENSKLNDVKKYKILSNGDLIIYDTQWEDLGVYVCIASNKYGQDRITAFFYPTEP